MKNDAGKWVQYAEENLHAAKLLLKSGLFNPCLQNTQQSVEKALKALLAEHSIKLQKTHSINNLAAIFSKVGNFRELDICFHPC